MISQKKFLVVFLAIVLTVIPFLQVSSQQEQTTISLRTPIESAIQKLDSAVKGATSQEDLAQKVFDTLQEFEYVVGIPISMGDLFLPPYLENQSEFNKVLDLIEEKWFSFPVDDFYDEVGIFLLYGNVIAGRFDKVETIFTKVKRDLPGRSIDPYFDGNSLVEDISNTIIPPCKKLFSPRKDLSLLYAAGLVMQMYSYQEKVDKNCEVMKLILDNYEGTKGAELLSIIYEYRSKYSLISEEEKKQLKDNVKTAIKEIEQMCEYEVKNE